MDRAMRGLAWAMLAGGGFLSLLIILVHANSSVFANTIEWGITFPATPGWLALTAALLVGGAAILGSRRS